MPLPEQQEYIGQVSLLHSKLAHLEETMKIEEKECRLKEKIAFLKSNSIREAKLKAKKDQENAQNEIRLQQEEQSRHDLVIEMVEKSDNSLSPITKVLVNFEGI